MERPGEKLRKTRERLKLTYRDVAEASQQIATRRNSEEYAIALSRLADIENKGTVPTIYRVYTLCAIYRLDWREVLRWYGVPLEQLQVDGMQVHLDETHTVAFVPETRAVPSVSLDEEIDTGQTTFLGDLIRRWGKNPFYFLSSQGGRHQRFGLIGFNDWTMYPILQPGALVLIDQNRRKIAESGWNNETERPIYFLELRDGYRAGWCASVAGRLLWQPHPGSQTPPVLFDSSEVDVVGQVTGVAMLLESKKRRHARTSTTPAKSPGL